MLEYTLSESDKKDKKYMVKFLNEYSGRINTIHFGSFGMSDYTISNDEKRKSLYKIRHSKDFVNDLNHAGAWSMNLLWNKKTILESIKDMEKRFRIKIVLKFP